MYRNRFEIRFSEALKGSFRRARLEVISESFLNPVAADNLSQVRHRFSNVIRKLSIRSSWMIPSADCDPLPTAVFPILFCFV